MKIFHETEMVKAILEDIYTKGYEEGHKNGYYEGGVDKYREIMDHMEQQKDFDFREFIGRFA